MFVIITVVSFHVFHVFCCVSTNFCHLRFTGWETARVIDLFTNYRANVVCHTMFIVMLACKYEQLHCTLAKIPSVSGALLEDWNTIHLKDIASVGVLIMVNTTRGSKSYSYHAVLCRLIQVINHLHILNVII